MGLRHLLKRRPQATIRRTPPPVAPRENAGPKNGVLALTVLASTLLLIGLVVLNARLIRDPSTGRRAAGSAPSPSSVPESCPSGLPSPSPRGAGKADRPPPQVTFYTKLQTQDDHPFPEATAKAGDQAQDKPAAHPPTGAQQSPKKQPTQTQRPAPPALVPVSRAAPLAALPKQESGSRVYTVQVGAFTHPSVAQEWAMKWKARGYNVSIKPVARPRTGVVTYSLYLGHFTSEKEADELVNRLKQKEGISALRLVVRN